MEKRLLPQISMKELLMDNSSGLHVLVIPTWLPSHQDRLIGIYHHHFCQALAACGVKVNMLFADRYRPRQVFSFLKEKTHWEEHGKGYTTYHRKLLNLSMFSMKLHMFFFEKVMDRLFQDYIKLHGKPDILHAQVIMPAGYLACKLGEKHGIPVIITEHSTFRGRLMVGPERPYCEYALAHLAKHTCVSKLLQDFCAKTYGVQSQLLPNIVDCSMYAGARNKAADGKLHLVSICALREDKHIGMVAKALKQLRDQGALPDFQYTVVGEGYYGAAFQKQVQEIGMDSHVTFVGKKNTEEIARILAQSDIFVLASSFETFGIPAVEVLAAGVSVVSTRCGGPESFLTSECAELCNVDDVSDMAHAILRMYERLPALEEAKLRNVAKQFDSKTVVQLAVSYYNEILNHKQAE